MTEPAWAVATPPIAAAPQLRPRRARLVKLSTLHPRPVQWLLPGRVPFGALTILAGPPGGGKSQFTIRLAADLSRAGVSSLFVGDEDGAEDTVLPRMLAAGGDVERVGLFDLEDDEMAQLPTDIPLLADVAKQEGAALIVIDPVQAHFAEEINPNVDASVRQATRPLARMAQKTGCAIVLVTHDRKSREGSLLDRIAASRGLTGAARSVLLFGRRKPSDSVDPWEEANLRYAAHIKCNGAPLAPILRCEIQGELVKAGDVSIETSQLFFRDEPKDIRDRDLE